MAKTSNIAAQRRREHVVATYALRRAELKVHQRRVAGHHQVELVTATGPPVISGATGGPDHDAAPKA